MEPAEDQPEPAWISGGRGALSLLWPAGGGGPAGAGGQLGEDAIADLRLDDVIAALVGGEAPAGRRASRERFARRVLTALVWQPAVIAYRQAVLTDLLEKPALRDALASVLPALDALGDAPQPQRYRPNVETGLERLARRLGDLEVMVDVVVRLAEAIEGAAVRSEGLRSLGQELAALKASATFRSLEKELPTLRATLASVRSVTIGVNIGPDLSPVSATVLGFSDEAVDGRHALVWRLLGRTDASRGLTPLQRGEAGPLGRPNELVRDLRQLMSQVIGPVQSALDHYASVSTQALSQLGSDLALLIGAARLVERLRTMGMPVCCPEIAPAEERGAVVSHAYDLGLTLGQSDARRASQSKPGIVTNTVRFDRDHGRVWVLTGPNRGGKTTYTRAVGLAQVLFQAGLYVPGSSARMSPVDAIFTHFPTREDTRPGLGRLDAEAERLGAIFRQATPRSLILLNEALAGTSALEALDLARGIVRGLRLLGARAIYVTHLHELASEVDDINVSTPGDGTVASLLAEASEDDDGGETRGISRRTYRILPGAPRGASFAAEIAEHHGISFAQLAKLLEERQVLPPPATSGLDPHLPDRG